MRVSSKFRSYNHQYNKLATLAIHINNYMSINGLSTHNCPSISHHIQLTYYKDHDHTISITYYRIYIMHNTILYDFYISIQHFMQLYHLFEYVGVWCAGAQYPIFYIFYLTVGLNVHVSLSFDMLISYSNILCYSSIVLYIIT